VVFHHDPAAVLMAGVATQDCSLLAEPLCLELEEHDGAIELRPVPLNA